MEQQESKPEMPVFSMVGRDKDVYLCEWGGVAGVGPDPCTALENCKKYIHQYRIRFVPIEEVLEEALERVAYADACLPKESEETQKESGFIETIRKMFK